MEIRKVQVTGGASFIISLPKEWARSQKIGKNDPLGVLIQEDGTLLITPKIPGREIQRQRTFDVSPGMDPVFLFRLLIAAYIGGYSRIRLSAAEQVPALCPGRCQGLHPDDHRPGGSGETEASITITDLLNPEEMPLDRTIEPDGGHRQVHAPGCHGRPYHRERFPRSRCHHAGQRCGPAPLARLPPVQPDPLGPEPRPGP